MYATATATATVTATSTGTATAAPPGPNRNHLLAALPHDDYWRLAPHLEPVALCLGRTLYEGGQALQYAYFPTSAVMSLYYMTDTGAAVEVAGVGNEGMVGIALFMGGRTMPGSAVVQTAGMAYRLDRTRLLDAFNTSGAMQRLLLRYAQALITQLALSAACNRHHTVEQQVSRWLLLTLDRGAQRELVVTQVMVAGLLGVRRESVTEAARRLQDGGYIRYRRGHISVVDRHGLASRACECYEVAKRELTRLMGDPLLRQGDPTST